MTHLTAEVPFVASYGYSRRLMYRTTVVQAASGRTERNSHWSYPLHVFGLPLQNRTQEQLEQIAQYFHAAGGAGNTFSFLDRFEDRSCAQADDPDDEDVTLGTATAAQTDFQLIKTYTYGGRTQTRKITRPVAASVVVAVDGSAQTVTTDYTIEDGGIIRFTSGLTGGEVVTAGFRFLVPVAFVSDEVDIMVHNHDGTGYIGDATVDLVEVRE